MQHNFNTQNTMCIDLDLRDWLMKSFISANYMHFMEFMMKWNTSRITETILLFIALFQHLLTYNTDL